MKKVGFFVRGTNLTTIRATITVALVTYGHHGFEFILNNILIFLLLKIFSSKIKHFEPKTTKKDLKCTLSIFCPYRFFGHLE